MHDGWNRLLSQSAITRADGTLDARRGRGSYETVLIDLEKDENRKPDFLAINPMGKLPTIVHRGTVVTETAAIIAYLADAFPAAGLAPPPGDPSRGAYYRWLFFGAGCFEPALLDTMLKRPPIERKMSVGWGSYEDVLGALKGALATGPYLLGEKIFKDYVARLSARPALQRTVGD
jgi:glutathione S-transferase